MNTCDPVMQPRPGVVRRLLCLAAVITLIALGLSSCRRESGVPRVVVIGFDGMDAALCERMMDAGRLPRLAALRAAGGYRPLGTTIPPQSPVAWASFITGANPGAHGIYDFIHRDPARQVAPYYSAAETTTGAGGWEVGQHRIPLTFWPFKHRQAQTLLRRGGTPFWDYLDSAGVPVWIYDIPANYPPSRSKHGHVHCLCGMGVPDVLGEYGQFQYFAENLLVPVDEPWGLRRPLDFAEHRSTAALRGPRNELLQEPQYATVPFTVTRHPTNAELRIDLQDTTLVLKEEEWSEWCRVHFSLEMPPFMPAVGISGICRFYIQSVHPARIYVTPINIDPSDPGEQRISEPPGFVTELSDSLGLFYTAGFQEDHKARSSGVFNDAEYLTQAEYVLEERLALLDEALARYDDGLLFFYVSSTDLQAHVFWWDSTEPHPVRSAEQARKYHRVVEGLYERMDALVGRLLDRFGPQTTVMVMSDHGFCNFRRQFNLNTWLRTAGYIQPADCGGLLDAQRPVDWTRTTCYGLGLNGLYVNLVGRERDGIVEPGQRDALLDELAAKLLAIRDPLTNDPVIARVYRTEEVYSGAHLENAPDLIVGYHRDYRASWATTLGEMTDAVLLDNDSAWSADHCIAAELVPGVLFSNRPITRDDTSIIDIAPTVLRAFGVKKPATMEGHNFLTTR